jgi:glycosyltransferase involved in cell wall biosynthesis
VRRRDGSPGTIRVGMNVLWMVPGVVGGTEDGTVALLHAFADQRDAGRNLDVEVVIYGLAPLAEAHPDLLARFPHHLVGLDGRNKARRVAAESTWLPVQLRRAAIDVVHHAGGVVPMLGGPLSGAAVVLTVHDLQPLELPEFFSPVKRRYLQAMLPRSVRAADLVLTASDYAGATVARGLGVDPKRLRTSPFGRTHELARAPTPAECREARARYRLPGPYFMYPAITYPHKNHAVLLDGFARLVAAEPADSTVALVLPGAAAGAEAAVADQIERLGLGDRVRRTGRIPRRDLDVLLAEATALALPSRYEGFGLPVLEAMAAGCPVIVARATALPEVVGDAGLLVSPDDPDQWTRAMRQLLHDPTLLRELSERGLERAADEVFSPAHAADVLAAAYRDGFAARRSGRP